MEEIKSKFVSANQGHVFDHYDDLSEDEKSTLLRQLSTIKVDELDGYFKSAMADSSSQEKDDEVITPFSKDVGRVTSSDDAGSQKDEYYKLGLEAIGRGEVAALVLAGGQGTRLGFSGPKGMYNIGLPSGRSLFQLLSERILKLSKLACDDDNNAAAASSLPFYIMTSPINHEETTKYLESKSYFGLPSDDVKCFQQGMLPCLTNEGKIIMETSCKVAMAPDGNGGIYPSLQNCGMIDDMVKRGIKHIHVFSIDNSLTRPADPVFIGYCISQNADCGNKVVWKANAHEKVGVVAEKSSKPCVVEYSEITTDMAEKTDDHGRLVFGAGNICNHYYTMDFLLNTVLPSLGDMYHVARKKIPYYDSSKKQTIKPESNNGIKLESFIFDVFPLSQRMAVLDVERSDEFAPVKNAPGSSSDSPDTARAYISNQAKRWIQASGGEVVDDKDDAICEIAPLTSYAGEGLEATVSGKKYSCPFSL